MIKSQNDFTYGNIAIVLFLRILKCAQTAIN